MSTPTETADGPQIDRESPKLLVRPDEQYLAAHHTAGV
jgi:hypothetical protein